MRIVVQRVTEAKVTVENVTVGQIEAGFMCLVGFNHEDNRDVVDKMVNKLVHLRIFEDDNEKLNLSLIDVKGGVLSISQFTLYADCKKGRRPSFIDAARPEAANPLYEYFNEGLRNLGIAVQTGVFGAMMDVSLVNSGPTTIILDSDQL
ncbi:MAG: D-aminoacyl-tRNA deacylase [Erysipelotrichaceae bacterium]|nr:D-aminoacyl-tRNA deacylase [Erysipelotrichaceae bacterium]